MKPKDADDAADWLRLSRSQNVGPTTFFDLLARYGSAAEALDALPALAARTGGKQTIRIATRKEVDEELRSAARLGLRPVFFGTADYPARLAAIHAPPPVLMVHGDAGLFSRPAVAVVGARNASAAGRTMARRLAEDLAAAGRVVVSGLALGIDAEAHKASLDGGTIAVLAGGIDRPTPEENVTLAGDIAARGALVSEMPTGMTAFRRHYVRRNRLIAGLADAVIVVEAAERSGALYTARHALDAGREVFAVPGSPLDPRAAGCLALLKEGASLATDARDVLDAVAVEPEAVRDSAPPGLSESGAPPLLPAPDALAAVRDALSVAPVPLDVIVRETGLAAGAVAGALMELELAGIAEREGGMARLAVAD